MERGRHACMAHATSTHAQPFKHNIHYNDRHDGVLTIIIDDRKLPQEINIILMRTILYNYDCRPGTNPEQFRGGGEGGRERGREGEMQL